MTIERANEILRTKYPEAEIINGKEFGGISDSNMAVIFKPGGKVYEYRAHTYQQVLERLGFCILYSHNIRLLERMAAELEQKIADGGEKNIFSAFDGREWIQFSETEIAAMQKTLDEYRSTLAHGIRA